MSAPKRAPVKGERPASDGACCQAAYDSDGFAHDHPVET